MKLLFLFPFFICSLLANAQKEVVRVLDAGSLKTLVLNSNEVFRVSITAAQVSDITVRTRSEGEYYNDIGLEVRRTNGILTLSSRFPAILRSGFDKLSAHKVFSMELILEVPEGMNIEIRSNLASVYLEGQYDGVFLELKTGSGFLKNFSGDAVINTYDGNIEVETINATIEAQSRHGVVTVPKSLVGAHRIVLTSINGNIRVEENL